MKGILENHNRQWIPKITLAKRWKILRYSIWLGAATLVWLFLTPAIGQWTGWWFFSPNFGYVFTLSATLWILALLLLPYGVRWTDSRLRVMKSLYHEQLAAFLAASLFPPTAYLSMVGIIWFFMGRSLEPAPNTLIKAVFFLGFACLILAASGIGLMSRRLSTRLADSIQLLANGIREASKLDFDHPIMTAQRDELGILSEIFNFMSDLLKSKVDFLRALYKNILVFSGLLNVEKILDHIPESFKALEEAEEILVALLDEKDGKMEVVRSSQGRRNVIGLRFGPGEGVFGRLLKQPQFLAYSGPDYLQALRDCETEAQLWGKPGFVVAIPILFKGKIKGAIGLYGMYLVDSHLDMKMDQLQGMANQIGIFLENARLYNQVIHDRLTDYYTHGFLEAELAGAIARFKTEKLGFCYLIIDLDKFKRVNDQYGHAAGNQLLIGVTQTIRSVIRNSDIPARFGGDEFEILLLRTSKQDGLACAKKIHKAVEKAEYAVADGVRVKITLSVGLAAYPEDAQSAIQLQAAADSALYDAKALGRNGIVVYEDNLKHLAEKLAKRRSAATAASQEART